MESQVFDAVQYVGGLFVGDRSVQGGGQVFERSTVHQDVLVTNLHWQNLVEDHSA